MIELSLFEHAIIAAAIQTLIGLVSGKWWAGGALVSGYFTGREVAQAEYRWIEQLGTGRLACPWHYKLRGAWTSFCKTNWFGENGLAPAWPCKCPITRHPERRSSG